MSPIRDRDTRSRADPQPGARRTAARAPGRIRTMSPRPPPERAPSGPARSGPWPSAV